MLRINSQWIAGGFVVLLLLLLLLVVGGGKKFKFILSTGNLDVLPLLLRWAAKHIGLWGWRARSLAIRIIMF